MTTHLAQLFKRGISAALIVTILSQSILPLAYAAELQTSTTDAEADRKSYIQNPPGDLYDQSVRLNDPEFLNLSIAQQDEILINDFKNKKYSYLDKKLFYAAIKASALAAVTLLGVGAVTVFRNDIWDFGVGIGNQMTAVDADGNPDEATRAVGAIKAYIGFIVGYIGFILGMVETLGGFPTFRNTIFGVWTAYDNRYTNRYEDPMLVFEVGYIKKKRFLDKNIAKVVEDSFKAARMSDTAVRSTMETVNIALNLPTESRVIQYDKKRMNKALMSYDDTIQDQAKSFILQQVLLQNHDVGEDGFSMAAPREGKRIVAFLNGPPGSGKTRLAQEIAKALKLPFGQVSLEGATLDDLQGTPLTSHSPTAGKILQAMAKAKYEGEGAKNMVLFIDEADRIINGKTSQSADILPFLLKLLDPENKTFYNPFFNTDIDVSNLIIILAGNHEIEDEALSKRLFTFYVSGFSTEVKRKIIWENWVPIALKNYSQNGQYKIAITDFSEADKQAVNDLITLDKDPGFRTLEKVISEYITYIAERKYFDKDVAAPKHLSGIVEKSNRKLAEKRAAAAR